MYNTAMLLSYEMTPQLVRNLKHCHERAAQLAEHVKTWSRDKSFHIQQMALVSQIGASTRIENALLTDAEIQWIDTLLSKEDKRTEYDKYEHIIKDKFSKDRERSVEEVAGCRQMLKMILDQAEYSFPLSESFLRGLHQLLLEHHPPAQHYIGKYKTVSNSVIERSKDGTERLVFQTAGPGPITEAAMRDLVQWYNRALPEETWTIPVVSEFVYRFLSIHPFQDGNGRIGRGLFLLGLLQSHDQNLKTLAPFLAIDRQIEIHKSDYYFVLQKCSEGKYLNDPKDYKIQFFAEFMSRLMLKAFDDIEYYENRYEVEVRLSEQSKKVFSCFQNYPERKLKIKDIENMIDVPRRTITYSLDLLCKSHLIQKYGRGPATYYQIVF